MIHASLFSGIGGFDLAARWAGWRNLFNCETDPFCRTVLKYHFPDAQQYGDIRTTVFTVWRDRIDVLTGGFPCQPFSVAGKRKGTGDDRYLWPEMLRAVREIRPRWVVGENVLGIVYWSNGLVFEQVCVDLEDEGYDVQPFVLPACGVDAPHRRDRVWFVAHCADSGSEDMCRREDGLHAAGFASHTESAGLPPCHERQRQEQPRRGNERVGIPPDWSDFPTQSPVCRRDDGFSGRLVGITFPRWRKESIKAYGNAIVPQVALRIFGTIEKIDNL